MRPVEQWFPLPDFYRVIENPETLKRFAAAYMKVRHPGWKPVKIRNYRVLAEWISTKEGGA